ncbi:hypothetical protein [Amycolatopsis sp. lyj-346]|uniref:hypothetical protein n=1 Tax=Amycolatopsis sp. lyj-346 TaxID=2789289 RepID=UPI0039793ED6
MGSTLSRVAGVVFAGALAAFAAAPAALAQTETSTSPTETTTSASETATSGSPTSTPASETPSTVPSSTSGIATATPDQPEAETTDKRIAPKAEPELKDDTQAPAKGDDYQDNAGHGFVGLGGEGVLVIGCAAGAPGNVATQYLSVTGGPDQDEADGRYWNYSVRVVDAPAGTTTAKFSWTCAGVEGNGIVEVRQDEPPAPTSTTTTTSSSSPSSTAPITTAAATTAGSAPAGNAAPKAQVKVEPKGGVETGFGGTAR